MSANITLFQSEPQSGAGGTGQYVIDNFKDVSNPATNNTSLTDNSNTNPENQLFANNDTPQYSTKTLFIKDLVLLQDRSKWISNKPTYLVEFTENYPGVVAYVFGNVRVRNQRNYVDVVVKNINDGMIVTGTFRNLSWGVNQNTTATSTSAQFTDNVSLGTNISFGNAASGVDNQGVNTFLFIKHATSLLSNDLHTVQINANQYNTLAIHAIQVYVENNNQNIQCFPGTTYVNKTNVVTTVGVGVTLPIITGLVGADTLVTKTAGSVYQLNTLEGNYINTVGIGSSGTNLVNVSTGQGASFPIGSGVVAVNGTSYYIGTVNSVSTDTLTVFPTLSFGLSGLFYKSWSAGPTFAVGSTLYGLATSIDLTEQNNFSNADGFAKSSTGNYYYSDPYLQYRIWGSGLSQSNIEGYPGITFQGATTGFFQIDGFFAAAQIEYVANGILNATFVINGVPAYSVNEGATGTFLKTIITDSGPTWNTIQIQPGTSLSAVSFTRIDLFNRVNPGITLGVLADFQTAVTKVYKYTHSATQMSLGSWQRIYGDNLYFNGGWIRGTTTTVAGNVFYAGSTNSCDLKLNYFGNDFAIIGSFGTSSVVLLDGASQGVIANNVFQVAGTTFHTLELQAQSGTFIISAVDFLRPQTRELNNRQNTLPRAELVNLPQQVFFQSDTPREARDGALWAKDVNTGIAYLKMGKRWLQLTITTTTDDPNGADFVLIKTHGTTTVNNFAAAVNTAETFNFASWSSNPSDTTAATNMQYGSAFLLGNHYALDGSNTAGTVTLLNSLFNKNSWSAGSNRSTARVRGAVAPFLGNFTAAKGNTGSGNSAAIDTFNGTSWANGVATLASATTGCAAAVQGGKYRVVGGNGTNAHDTWTGTATAVDTNYPTPHVATVGAISNAGNAIFGGNSSADTNSYQWSGSWSATITMTYAPKQTADAVDNTGCSASGFNMATNISYISAGDASTTTPTAVSASFNGTSWSSITSANIAVANGMGAVY